MPKDLNSCPWCGGVAHIAAETCDNCGEPMHVPAPTQTKPAPSGPVFRTVRDKGMMLESQAA